MFPLLPELAVPVLNTSIPLTPETPAFAVDTNIDPLDDMDPYPLRIIILPPVVEDDSPADRMI
jgi:hypothetical protein